MILNRLRLRNFMSYRDAVPPLDFTSIHLACLTGDNGHGKSALLDAMTWALWGKARVSRDDLLIHTGADDMEVEIDFAVGDEQYRVLRKRDSRRKQSSLEFQGFDNGNAIPLTEPTIRATQEKIDHVLRMDYDTFINTAFLMQGRADEFTMKPPGERKRILGEILGLGEYDKHAEEAKVRSRYADDELTRHSAQLDRIDDELSHVNEHLLALESAEETVLGLNNMVETNEGALTALQKRERQLEAEQVELDELNKKAAAAKAEVARIDVDLSQVEATHDRYSRAILEADKVNEGYTALVNAREQKAMWDERVQARWPVLQKQQNLKRELERAETQLTQEHSELMTRLSTLSEDVKDGEAAQETLVSLRKEVADLTAQQEALTEVQRKIADLTSERKAEENKRPLLTDRRVELQEHLDALQSVSGAICPTCRQDLDHERSLVVQAGIKAELAKIVVEREAIDTRIDVIDSQTTVLRAEAEKLHALAKGLSAVQADVVRAETKVEAGQAAMAKGRELAPTAAALEKRIKSNDFAHDVRTELDMVGAQLATLHYDSDAHELAKTAVMELETYEAQKRSLDTATERIPELQERIDALRNQRQRWVINMGADDTRRNELKLSLLDLDNVSEQVRSLNDNLSVLRTRLSGAQRDEGAARQKVEHCDMLKREREAVSEQRKKAAKDVSLFSQLREAFGRAGVQALIIEAALPELEHEANVLLSRMTEGRMSLQLNSQRETQAGDTRETLDIFVSDGLGVRAYDLFSGGEAYRVNFALRMAISKLLARRAGAQLRTLFIDEGFGTQDAQGRERLVEAINTIQEDFDRVLVITHIEELKDVFPARLDVVKTAAGSTVTVS